MQAQSSKKAESQPASVENDEDKINLATDLNNVKVGELVIAGQPMEHRANGVLINNIAQGEPMIVTGISSIAGDKYYKFRIPESDREYAAKPSQFALATENDAQKYLAKEKSAVKVTEF